MSESGWTPSPKPEPNVPRETSPPATEAMGVTMNFEQLQRLMATMAANIVAELKRPTEEEARKTEEERVKLQARRDEMIRIAREEEALRNQTQATCAHQKPNGQPAEGGQRYSDGKVRIFCLRCQKVLREYEPSAADWAGGFGNISDDFGAVRPQ